ncbi:uncharacterized protein TNCV_2110601 [Trichonephila clavipes]|nr:uncharacterized protein TNCV_2110601 [Trichonephila clavipes]
MKTLCLKCGGEHRTGQCDIKEKINNLRCINCNAQGHMVSSTECPLFLKPRKGKGQSQKENKKRNEINQANSAFITPGLSFAQATNGKNSQQRAARGNDSSTPNCSPPTPTRYGTDSASTLDYALIKNLIWPCTADSIPELSSDHNPVRFYFPRTSNFDIPPPQLNTTWSIFTKILANPENFVLPTANSTHEIDSQVSNLTSEILNAHASASRPFYHTKQPYVQGELKELIKERNKARKTWQQTRHPQHKSELNRLQNAIKRKNYHYRQQAWEDNLSTLNAEDNSLWGIAKAFMKKTSPISALNDPTGYFPKSWKTAVAIPILKPGKNSALAESYRTISLLPVLSKLAEKVILARLNYHLERENILIPE